MKNTIKILVVSLVAISLTACSAPRTNVTTDDQSGTIIIKAKPSSSIVIVDGVEVGKGYDFSGSAKVLKLKPGKHVIELKNDDKTCTEQVYLSDTQEVIECDLR